MVCLRGPLLPRLNNRLGHFTPCRVRLLAIAPALDKRKIGRAATATTSEEETTMRSMNQISLFLMMAADKANGGGSKKWDAAVNRATGQGDAPASDAPSMPVSPMISKVSQDDINKITADPTLEFAPQVHKLEEGDMVEGILEGNGPDAELEQVDRATKEVKINVVKTWIIAHPSGGQRISILSSAQLDRKLPPFVGSMVKIVRGKDIETRNGQRVTDYLVAGPKRQDGVKRSWAMKPVLDVPSTAGALPEGSGAHEGVVDTKAPASAS